MYVAVLPHIEYEAMLYIVYVALMPHTAYCGYGSTALHCVGSILCMWQYYPAQHTMYVTNTSLQCTPYMQVLLHTMSVKWSQHIKL